MVDAGYPWLSECPSDVVYPELYLFALAPNRMATRNAKIPAVTVNMNIESAISPQPCLKLNILIA